MKVRLKEIYFFKDLSDETLEKINSITSAVTLSKDNVLFYEKDKSKFLYFLESGIIKLYKTSSNEKEIVLKYFYSNEFIAEVANFEDIPYPATAVAFVDSVVLRIDFEKLKEIIYSDNQLSYMIQVSLIKKIRNLENIISSHLVLDSKERVAKYLCEHTEDFFNMKNLLIAETLNMTPETFSRMLKFFKDNGFIDVKNKTVDEEKLKIFYKNS